jgi:hypothetical protein
MLSHRGVSVAPETYLVESFDKFLEYGGGRVSGGTTAESYDCYLHLLDLERDEVEHLVPVLDRRGNLSRVRRGPAANAKWWFVSTSAKAHWPGRSSVRAVLRNGRIEPLDEGLVRTLREAGEPASRADQQPNAQSQNAPRPQNGTLLSMQASAEGAVQFPQLSELQSYPFERQQPVPDVPQIYLMYSPLDHAGRVGSSGGNGQFRKHARPSSASPGGKFGPSWGWFEDMHRSTSTSRVGLADSMHRLGRSNFCWDAHRWGAERFVYYVLESGAHLAEASHRRCREQQFMDALRDQTDMEDYTGQAACSCGKHARARMYVRAKPRPR